MCRIVYAWNIKFQGNPHMECVQQQQQWSAAEQKVEAKTLKVQEVGSEGRNRNRPCRRGKWKEKYANFALFALEDHSRFVLAEIQEKQDVPFLGSSGPWYYSTQLCNHSSELQYACSICEKNILFGVYT